jgi:hypothetical protein
MQQRGLFRLARLLHAYTGHGAYAAALLGDR